MLVNSVLDAIGNIPLVQLKKMSSGNVFVKAEHLNPGGSIKDRVAKHIIEMAEKEGKLKPGMTIIEATSGNTGIGLTLVGVQKGYQVICVMPENMSEERKKIIQAFNILLSQQLLQHHVEEVCFLLSDGKKIIPIDEGHVLFSYFFKKMPIDTSVLFQHRDVVEMYRKLEKKIMISEQIYSLIENGQTFHVFVPFVPRGEFIGVLYMKSTPNFGMITKGIISSYNETSIIFIVLILLGLIAMFIISSYTVKERDEAQRLLYLERERKLKENITLQKEALFAKRIYHTHHKAEKVMGFIKEEISALTEDNIEEIKYRVKKYASFISRVIYDMKWYDPPIQTVRNPFFKTDLNELICFIIDNIFMRVAYQANQFEFELELDDNLPMIHINEFVVWEIIEPLIQNSIEHGGKDRITIKIKTRFYFEENKIILTISDNGVGIKPELLEISDQGIKKIFLENISTKESNYSSSGYGCYIAYEIASQRCGWDLDVYNLQSGGCEFRITICL